MKTFSKSLIQQDMIKNDFLNLIINASNKEEAQDVLEKIITYVIFEAIQRVQEIFHEIK